MQSFQLTLGEVLEPAAELAERGFPVAEITAHDWARWSKALKDDGKALGGDFLINNRPPKHGQLFTNPSLAGTYRVTMRPPLSPDLGQILKHINPSDSSKTHQFYKTIYFSLVFRAK